MYRDYSDSYEEEQDENKNFSGKKVKAFSIHLTGEEAEKDHTAVNEFLAKVNVSKKYAELVSGPENFWSILFFYTEKEPPKRYLGDFRHSPEKYSDEEYKAIMKRVEILFNWRLAKAKSINQPFQFLGVGNKMIDYIAEESPQTLSELQNIQGVSGKVVQNYGEEIIKALKEG